MASSLNDGEVGVPVSRLGDPVAHAVIDIFKVAGDGRGVEDAEVGQGGRVRVRWRL